MSFQLAARAIKVAKTDQALDALREVLPQTFLHAQLKGHTSSVMNAAFSPDGKWVVTASKDNTARVWEAATGRSLATLQGHTDSVNSAAFSPDGKWVITASDDKAARVYPYEMFAPAEEVIERAQLRVLRALTPLEQARFGIEEQSTGTGRQNRAKALRTGK